MAYRNFILALLLALAPCLVLAGCDNGGGGDDDADAADTPAEGDTADFDLEDGEDPVDDPVPDPTEDPIPDVVPDEDAAGDTVEDDGGGAAGNCEDPIVLGCGDSLGGQTTVGADSVLQDYACLDMPELGPERVYAITGTEESRVEITMTPAGETDLDLWVLEETCDPDSCLVSSPGFGSEFVAFTAEVGTVYYVVVDGFAYEEGGFSIEAVCSTAEICDNEEDDNDNGLVDCEDSDCWEDDACAEICDNGEDEDFDGLIDCEDIVPCFYESNCFEYVCDDEIDDDNDTLINCDDPDCIGDDACATGDGAFGDPCESNDDCESGACLREPDSGWPGGFCTVYSETEDDCGGCPEGGTCFGWSPIGPFTCFKECDGEEDCRDGYECDIGGMDVCVGMCTSGDDCVVTGYCEDGNNLCIIAPELCTGGDDEDGDTLADCADLDCFFSSDCSESMEQSGGNTCAEAVEIIPLHLPVTMVLTGTIELGAGDDHDPGCDSESSTVDVVYKFTLAAETYVAIDLMGASGELTSAVLSLSRHCDEPDLRCSFRDFLDVNHARITGTFAAGTYYINVEADRFYGLVGDYTLGVHFAEP